MHHPQPRASREWIEFGPARLADTKPEPPVKIKQIPGARYAATRMKGMSNIGVSLKFALARFFISSTRLSGFSRVFSLWPTPF
jgi:hypothetical protein